MFGFIVGFGDKLRLNECPLLHIQVLKSWGFWRHKFIKVRPVLVAFKTITVFITTNIPFR